MVERVSDGDLDVLARELEAALGGDLVSLLLYGSAARGGRAERSDVNLLLILTDASPSSLRRAAPALEAWSRTGRRPPLIHSQSEWRAAADVFPVEMDDIREAHQLLAGRDPTAGVQTRPADVRRELERETRGVLTRLRAAWAALGSEGASLEELLQSALGTILVLLRAAIRLTGSRPGADAADVVREAAGICGFEGAAFDWALAARSGKPPRRLAAFDPVATQYLEAMERFAQWLDGHSINQEDR